MSSPSGIHFGWGGALGRFLRPSAFPLAAALLAACTSPVTDATLAVQVEVLDNLRRYQHVYVLQPDDAIEVFVYRHPEFSRRTTIRPDGIISLLLLGEIKAAGKAPRELNKQLTELFGQRLVNPEMTVIVENALEPMVFVLGEVGAPRTITLHQAKTVA